MRVFDHSVDVSMTHPVDEVPSVAVNVATDFRFGSNRLVLLAGWRGRRRDARLLACRNAPVHEKDLAGDERGSG